MCGLVGIASHNVISGINQDIFDHLLYADVVRGGHATGVAAVRSIKSKSVTIMKRSMPSPELISTREYKDFMQKSAYVLMGHNRHATKGSHSDRNAHPFRYKHITMAHNGTLTNHKELTDEHFEVDSEALCLALAQKENTVELLESIQGAFALTWFDQRDGSINFARNKERPFSFAVSDDDKTIVWASEMDMLYWIVNRNTSRKFQYYTLEVGHWLKLDAMRGDFKQASWKAEEFKPAEKKTKAVTTWNNGYGDNWEGGYNRRISKTLSKYGVALGDEVMLYVDKFTSYAASQNGNVIAYEFDDTHKSTPFLAFNVSKNEIVSGYISAKVDGLTTTVDHNRREAIRIIDVKKVDFGLNDDDGKEHYSGEVDDDDFVPGPRGVFLLGKLYKQRISTGCINCGAPLNHVDPESITWVNDEQDPMCSDCLEELCKDLEGCKQ